MKYSGPKIKIMSMINMDFVEFDAYVTDMGQTFSSTWNTEDVFGRNDPIATFQGTKRAISLSFDVPSGNESEAKANLEKCSKLASFLYPGYTGEIETKRNPEDEDEASDDPLKRDEDGVLEMEVIESRGADGFARPPLIKIHFANIINSLVQSPDGIEGLLGYIDSYTFTPVVDAGFFGGYSVYPRTITVSLSFNVLHQSLLGFQKSKKKNPKKGEDEFEIKWASSKLPFG